MALFDKSVRVPMAQHKVVRLAWRLRVWLVIAVLAAVNLGIWALEDSQPTSLNPATAQSGATTQQASNPN